MLVPLVARADSFSSTNFTVENPVMEPAGYGTSSNYALWGTIPYIAASPGSSTNFAMNGGFLSFEGATMPVLTATADVDALSLTWTAVTGAVAVTYEAGIATTPGGPYTYSHLLSSLSYVWDRLEPSEDYYLIVRVKERDTGFALLGYSNELAISTYNRRTSGSGSVSGSSTSTPDTTTPPTTWTYVPGIGLVPTPTPSYPGGSLAPGADGNGQMGAGDGASGEVLLPGESMTITPQLFRQFGYVFTLDDGAEDVIGGAVVTLWRLNAETGEFELWPTPNTASMLTDKFGLFSFMVPSGTYRITVDAEGYMPYASGEMLVDATGRFEQSIELTKDGKSMLVDIPWSWLTIVSVIGALLVILMVVAMFGRLVKRRRQPPESPIVP